MKGNRIVRIVDEGLQRVALPTLSRPGLKPAENPKEVLINWGTQYYAYSLIAHVRTILKGVLQLCDAENVPAAYIIGRHIFECAAHACYMNRNLHDHYQQKQWSEAWKLLSAAAIGNLWMKRHGTKYADPSTAVVIDAPNPIRIGEAVSAYELYLAQEGRTADAKDSYSFLSEHSHPNSACLQQYHIYENNGRDLRFCEPDPTLVSPLPTVNWCLIDLLTFLRRLLAVSNETKVQSQVVALLKQLAEIAPKGIGS